MRTFALLALIAFGALAASCAADPFRPIQGPTYRLDVYTVRGADLFAKTVDYNLSADDCAKAQRRHALSVCEVEGD